MITQEKFIKVNRSAIVGGGDSDHWYLTGPTRVRWVEGGKGDLYHDNILIGRITAAAVTQYFDNIGNPLPGFILGDDSDW